MYFIFGNIQVWKQEAGSRKRENLGKKINGKEGYPNPSSPIADGVFSKN